MKGTWRELAAEFLGTFILVVFGTAVVAQVLLSNEKNGQYLSINLGWGLAVTMGMFVAGGVSGAHLNPAVTLSLAVQGKFAWWKLIPYWIAQVAGAFAAAAVTYFVYIEALELYILQHHIQPHMGGMVTAGIWSTYPAPHLSTVPGGLIDQIVGTALLIACISAITDARNIGAPSYLAPLFVGALVVLIGMTFGYNSGYAINPARDFGPRLFTSIAGWGKGVFTAGNHWWWVPIVGPLLGGVLGGFLYDFFVGSRLKGPEDANSTSAAS
jgi:MIP family channel proteins